MARVLVFFIFFILFLALKGIVVGSKKVLEIGAEAFDAVNDTNLSEKLFLLKEPEIDEAIVGLLVIGAYEDGKIDSIKKSIINHTINEFVSVAVSAGADKKRYEDKLYKIWMKIDEFYKNFFGSGCFFNEYINLVNKFITSINEKGSNEVKKTLIGQLIVMLVRNNENKECKKEFIYLVGRKLGIDGYEIDNMIKSVNPNFNFTEDDVFDKDDDVFNEDDVFDEFFEEERKYQKDPYEVLGVSQNDSFETIKKKYKELVRKFHPDFIESKGLDEEFIKFANEKLKEINWAFEEIKKERGL